MPTCKNCGKKGIFLRLNSRGLCKECAEKAAATPRTGQIVITVSGVVHRDATASIGHDEEEKACQYFIDELVKRGKDRSRFKIEHRSSEYTSLFYDLDDFIRIKITDNVHWISIAVTEDDADKYSSDPLFAGQKNKQQRHWRSDFENESDLERYLDLADHACLPTTYNYNRSLKENEIKILDYLMQLFIDCGADPNKFYCRILSEQAELLYNSQTGNILFKAYMRKPGGYLVLDYDFKSAGIKNEKDRYTFTELSELDFLKDKLIPIKIKAGIENKYRSDMRYYTKYPLK